MQAGMVNITTAHSILGLPLHHCLHAIVARTVCTRTTWAVNWGVCQSDICRRRTCSTCKPIWVRLQLRLLRQHKRRKASKAASADSSVKKKRFIHKNINFSKPYEFFVTLVFFCPDQRERYFDAWRCARDGWSWKSRSRLRWQRFCCRNSRWQEWLWQKEKEEVWHCFFILVI